MPEITFRHYPDSVKMDELDSNADKNIVTKEVFVRGVIETEDIEEKVWLHSPAIGLTPLKDGLKKTKKIVEKWINDDHFDNYPPVVINVDSNFIPEYIFS